MTEKDKFYSKILNHKKLLNLFENYYNWEKEKEKLFFDKRNNENNIFGPNEKFYLIDKNWMNKFKNFIEYDRLREKIEKENPEKISTCIEDIIIQKNNKDQFELISKNLDNIEEKNVINYLIDDTKNFDLEIINEKVQNSLIKYNGIKLEISGKIIGKTIFFEKTIEQKNIIILIFPKAGDFIYKLYFILDLNDSFYENLKKKIEEKNFKEIFEKYEINLENIIENEKYKKQLKEGEKESNRVIIAYKIQNNYKITPDFNSIKIQLETFNITNKNEDINKFLKSLKISNEKFKKALTKGEIVSNYSPCKIISKKWMEDFIKIIEDQNRFYNNKNINNKYKELIRNFPKLSDDNYEKGDIFIIEENCFISLFPLVIRLEENSKYFLDYKIFLINNNKGAIIINKNIYIFETKDDINDRLYYKKIKGKIIYEFLYKAELDENFKLTEDFWNLLKNNTNKKSEKEIKINKLSEEKKRNASIISEKDKEIKNLLEIIKEKENEISLLKKKREDLEKKLKEKMENQKVILNKIMPTIGLQNLGATCYMNATLQCIAHFHEISEKILTWYKYSNDKNKKSKKLSYSFAEVLNKLYFPNESQNNINNNNNYNHNSKNFAPNDFKELIGNLNPLFKGVQANDSKDLMNFMIEKMHEELNSLGRNNQNQNNINYNDNEIIDQTNELQTYNNFKNEFEKNYHSILSEYLYGIIKTVTLCGTCKTMIFNFQTFNFLIFPLLDVKKYILYNNSQNPFFNAQNHILNLIDCFQYYQKIDFFAGQNQIFCNRCQCLQNANYCTMLFNVPTILCIVLNRGKDNKDFKENIYFGANLNLTDFVQDKNNLALYYLIGVVVHVGDSSMSGHFFAYSRSHFTSPWYKYNDSIVTKVNEDEIYSVGTPYILFYHKYQ